MSAVMNEDQLKALAAELAKDLKSEKDLGALTQQLLKLPPRQNSCHHSL